MKMLNLLLTLSLAASGLHAESAVKLHSALNQRFYVPSFPVSPALNSIPLPSVPVKTDEKLWKDIVEAWKVLLSKFKITEEHAKLVRDKNIAFNLETLSEDALAVWKADEGIAVQKELIVYADILKTDGKSRDEIIKIMSIAIFPTIVHELRHGLTHYELQGRLGFAISFPMRWNETISYVDELMIWRDPDFQKLYQSIKGDLLAEDTSDECKVLEKTWTDEGPKGVMKKFVPREGVYVNALDSECAQEAAVKIVAKVAFSGKEMFEKLKELKENLTKAADEDEQLKVYMKFLGGLIKDDAKREEFLKKAELHGVPPMYAIDKLIINQEKNLKRFDEVLKVVSDPKKYKQTQDFYVEKSKNLEQKWKQEKELQKK